MPLPICRALPKLIPFIIDASGVNSASFKCFRQWLRILFPSHLFCALTLACAILVDLIWLYIHFDWLPQLSCSLLKVLDLGARNRFLVGTKSEPVSGAKALYLMDGWQKYLSAFGLCIVVINFNLRNSWRGCFNGFFFRSLFGLKSWFYWLDRRFWLVFWCAWPCVWLFPRDTSGRIVVLTTIYQINYSITV